jgi:hypothetical protein
MSEEHYLSIRQLFSETVILNLILFGSLFIFTLGQDWNDIFLFLFPIITFCFSLFFKLIDVNKWRTKFEDSPLIYNPLGSEKKNANRFNFSAILQLIFLFWIGAESYYHPQLIDDYAFYFNLLFLFLYTFVYFWIFVDIWKYSRIKISYKGKKRKTTESLKSYEKMIKVLNVKNFRIISYINLFIFLILNGLNFLIIWFTFKGSFPGVYLQLPGTGTEFSQPLLISYMFLPVLIISPLYFIPLLYLVYRDINSLNEENLDQALKDLPKNERTLFLKNFTSINRKLSENIDIEQLIDRLERDTDS